MKMVKEVREKEIIKTFLLFLFLYIAQTISTSIGLIAIIIQIAFLYHNEYYEYLTTGKIFATLDLLQYLKFILLICMLGMTASKDYLNIMERSKNIFSLKP